MADENAHLASEKLVQLGKVCSGLACGDGYSQLRIHCDEVVAGGEVSFSETEDGGDSRSMGCHKDAIDYAWTRWGVSKSRNDDHLIGISDDRALMGVSVVCGARSRECCLLCSLSVSLLTCSLSAWFLTCSLPHTHTQRRYVVVIHVNVVVIHVNVTYDMQQSFMSM